MFKRTTILPWHAQENDYPFLALPKKWDNVSLTNMPNLRYLNLIFIQAQGTWTWQVAKFKVTTILPWHVQGNDYPPLTCLEEWSHPALARPREWPSSLGMPNGMTILPGARLRGWPSSLGIWPKGSAQLHLTSWTLISLHLLGV
jgi:hypothetical protein